MKFHQLLVVGLLMCFGLLSAGIVQAPWNFVTTEWDSQYTINYDEYMSWGANHTENEKWNVTCQVVGYGFINFYIFSQNHYETYVSQFGFPFASEMFEFVQNVNCEHDFTSTTGWWIVVENDYSQNVTIQLKVDLYSWQEPTTTSIPGYPWGASLIGIILALVIITVIRQRKPNNSAKY